LLRLHDPPVRAELTGLVVVDVSEEEEDDAEGGEGGPPGEQDHQHHGHHGAEQSGPLTVVVERRPPT